ncbi:MAG: hypothetical protein WCJ64_27115 [Rhodospirillaceae bacterium]
MKLRIDKERAAFEQLDLAIELLATQRSPIAVHTLVAAAREIIDGLCRHRNVESFNEMVASIYIKPGYIKLWRQKVREAANFFKHADHDPDK